MSFATYPSVTNDLHVSTAPCLHENVIFRVLTHMLLLRTLSRSRSLHPNHSRDHCRLHVHIPKHSRVRRLNPICQPNTEQFQGVSIPSVNPTVNPTPSNSKETQSHLSTQQGASGTEPRRRRQTHAHVKGSHSRVATTTKIVAAGEKPDSGASSHHRHDAGAPSVLHRA